MFGQTSPVEPAKMHTSPAKREAFDKNKLIDRDLHEVGQNLHLYAPLAPSRLKVAIPGGLEPPTP